MADERAEAIAQILQAAVHGDSAELQILIKSFHDLKFSGDSDERVSQAVGKMLSEQDADGWTALHYACQGGTSKHTQAVKSLCDGKADVNVVDNNGRSPLHVAAQFAEKKAIETLIESLADRHIRDVNNMTPCDCANGRERKQLLLRPQDVLHDLVSATQAKLHATRDFCVFSKHDLDAKRELSEHLERLIKSTDAELRRLKTKISSMMDQPLKAGSFEDRYETCYDLGRVKAEIKDIFTDIHEAESALTKLKENLADDILISELASLHKELVNIELALAQSHNPDATRKKNIVILRKCRDRLDHELHIFEMSKHSPKFVAASYDVLSVARHVFVTLKRVIDEPEDDLSHRFIELREMIEKYASTDKFLNASVTRNGCARVCYLKLFSSWF